MQAFKYQLSESMTVYRQTSGGSDRGMYFSVSQDVASMYAGCQLVAVDLPLGTKCLVMSRRLTTKTMVDVFQYLGLGDFNQWNDNFFAQGMFNSRNREMGDVLAWRIVEEGCTKVDAIWLTGEGIGDHPSNTDEFIVPLHYQNRLQSGSSMLQANLHSSKRSS